jgi:UDP-N-acetylmuramate dehydrogenase
MSIENISGFKKDVVLAPFTSFKIGGPADYFLEAYKKEDLISSLKAARAQDIRYFILGGGSNILISDRGFRGLVIRNQVKNLKFTAGKGKPQAEETSVKPRLEQVDEGRFYVFEDSGNRRGKPVYVEVDSGWGLEELAKELFSQDIVGLEPFAGIPGTVGGAVYTNAHGGPKFFGDRVVKAAVLSPEGEVEYVGRSYFGFDYDRSRLQGAGSILLAVTLQLWEGDGRQASAAFDAWKERKILQPKRSAGCIFQNLTSAQQEKLGIPTNSVGYVLEKLLKMKGAGIGDARVSGYHAAFIVNRGKAEASQVKDLIALCKQKAEAELGIELVEEIEYVGF